MSDNDLPEGTVDGAPMSFDEGVDSIDNLLGPVTVDPDEEDESNEAEADDAQEEADDSVDDSADEDEATDDEDVESEEEDDDSEEEPEVQLAPDDLTVEMEDGTRITVAELKRNNLFQSDYTRKTTALAEDRKQVEQRSRSLEEAAQTLSQHRDFMLRWYEQNKPEPPDPSMMDTDPLGYLREKDMYDRRSTEWQQLQSQHQMESQRQQQELQAQQAELLKQEREKLFEVMPHLKDQARFNEFRADAIKYGTESYGFTTEEIGMVGDSRYLRVLNDAIAYRKLQQKVPKAKEAVKGKPKTLKGSKRNSPQAKTSQGAKARAANLAKTGDFDAGVAALMDFDL